MAYGERTTCKAPECRKEIVQIGGGHRPRLYCDDNCRQRAFQARREQVHKDEVARRWQAFTPETRSFLDWLSTYHGYGNLATAVETAINRELAHRLASTVDEQNIRHIEKYAIDCCLDAEHAKKRCAELEQELEQRQRGLEQVQERFRAYVEMTNERLEEQAGELAKFRQEQERLREKQLTRVDKLKMGKSAISAQLEQAQADLRRIRQERAQEQEEIHTLSQNALELKSKLGAANNRIADLEAKQAQALGTREQLQLELLAMGEALHWRLLIVGQTTIPRGEECWQCSAEQADLSQLAQAVEAARHFYENLKALDMV